MACICNHLREIPISIHILNDYETKEFLNERYVKEPYAREYVGIHYGEKGGYIEVPYSSEYIGPLWSNCF